MLLERGRKLFHSNLIRKGRIEQAQAYAKLHGLTWNPPGGRGFSEGLAENINSSTCAEINLKNCSSAPSWEWPADVKCGDFVALANGTRVQVENIIGGAGGADGGRMIVARMPRGPLDDSGVARRVTDEGGAVTGGTLVGGGETAAEYAVRAEYERTHLPEWRPAREVLPKGVRWAVVTEHGGVNRLLREVKFEDNGLVGALWLSQRLCARGMAPKGKVVAVEFNEARGKDWALWVRK